MLTFTLDKSISADMELVVLLLTLAAFATAGLMWRRWFEARWNYRALCLAVGLLGLVLTVATMFGRGIILDEVVHTHAAWMMAHGFLPYRDFWDNHPPSHWLLVSLLLRRLPPGAYIHDLIRVLSVALSAVSVILAMFLASRVWGERQVMLPAGLLLVGEIVFLDFYFLRADLFANVCTLGALCLLATRRDGVGFWGSGVLIGLALSFTPRHWVYVLLVPLFLLWAREHYAGALRLALFHFLGMALGLVPLTAWLLSKGLLADCVFWTLRFHADMGAQLGGTFPLLVTALAVWGGILLLRSDSWRQDPAGKLLVLALGLAAFGYLTQPNGKFTYAEQMFGLLAAVVGSGPAYAAVRHLVAQRRTVLVCVLAGLYLWPVIYWGQHWQRSGEYRQDLRDHQLLLDLAGGEPVVCMAPWHPTFVADATYFSHLCQYYSYSQKPEIRAPLRSMPEEIIRKRPPLISTEVVERFGKIGIFTPAQSAALTAFLTQGYRKTTVGEHGYWVRNDRASHFSLPPWHAEGSDVEAPPDS